MEHLLTYLLQFNLLITIVFAGYHFLLKNLTYHFINRLYFLIGACYALVYPLIDLKHWFVTKTSVSLPLLWDYLPIQQDQQITAAYSLYDVVLLGIAIGTFVFLGKLFIQMVSLFRIHHHSKEAKWQDYIFRNVLFPIVPFSFFNKIYIHKEQHHEVELNDIFEHENVHVKGQHTWDVLFFELLLIISWYNPFVWMIRKSVRQNLEFLTDQQVLNTGVDKQTYQYSLLHVSQQGTAVKVSNQFNIKILKKRILMMNRKRSSRLSLSKYVFLLPVFILIGASFTVNRAESKIEEAVAIVKDIPFDILAPTQKNIVNDHSLEEKNDSNLHQLDTVISDQKEREITKERPEPKVKMNILGLDASKAQPLMIVDNKEMSNEQMKSLDPHKIESMTILKNESAIHYGEKGENGVILINTKEGLNPERVIHNDTTSLKYNGAKSTIAVLKMPAKSSSKVDLTIKSAGVLFVVDDKVMNDDFAINSIKPEDIESINVIKDINAVSLYGERAKSGVIIIKKKKINVESN